MKNITLLLALSFLFGCTTNYVSQFYRDGTAGVSPAIIAQRLLPYSGATKIFNSDDQRRDGAMLMQRGYLLIGQSAFEGAVSVTEAQLMEQAKKVGADIVLYSSRYQGSSQAAVPFMQYNPGNTTTTYSTGAANASAYGTGGSAYGTANYSGTTTTTSSGTFSTTIVPITIDRYSHGAAFWRKGRPPIFGVFTDTLPEEVRKKLQRNMGAIINTVMDDSPAFRANILAGDVVIALGDTQISSPQHLSELLAAFSGQKVLVTILRDVTEIKFAVQMNPKF